MLKQSDRYSTNQPSIVTLLEHLDVALQEVFARESMEPSQVSRTGFSPSHQDRIGCALPRGQEKDKASSPSSAKVIGL